MVRGECRIAEGKASGVVPQRGRIIIVGNALAVVSEKAIDALLQWRSGGIRTAQSPFAKGAGGITILLESPRERKSIGRERKLSLGFNFAIIADDRVPGVFSGKKDAARRRADSISCVMLSETHAFSGETIKVRRADFGLAISADIAVAEVVGQEEDNVGFSIRAVADRRKNPKQKENEPHASNA